MAWHGIPWLDYTAEIGDDPVAVVEPIIVSSTSVTSSTAVRSVKKPIRSVNSVSCGSLNHVDTGTALEVWNI